MLEQAVLKLRRASHSRDLPSPYQSQIEFLRHTSLPLPFPDAAFDVICALEVLELFPDMDEPLRELTRLLRPGGILLTSRGTEESGRRAKIKSAQVFGALLEAHGMEQIQISKWWKLFDRVTAVKRGASRPVSGKSLAEVLVCSVCQSRQWSIMDNKWICKSCSKVLPVTEVGIILN
jgi:SAM-dependent methyltransferase